MKKRSKSAGKQDSGVSFIQKRVHGVCTICGGTNIVKNCSRCGAPECCVSCCEENYKELLERIAGS